MIKYETGVNMFDVLPTNQNVIIPHVCNNVYRWGGGFTSPLSNKFPAARDAYLELPKLELGETQLVQAEPLVVVANMIAQHKTGPSHGVPPIRYDALRKCMEIVKEYCEQHPGTVIHAPKFGAGLAGGDWTKIEPLILELWSAFDVTIYSL